VESAARSFAISGKQPHLNPFYTATKATPQKIKELKLLLRDDTSQLQTLTAIESVIANHLKVMQNMVDLGSKNVFRAVGQRDLTDQGYTLMEQIRAALGTIKEQHRVRLEQQQSAFAAGAYRITMISLAGIVWATALVLLGGGFSIRAVRERGKAEEKLARLLGSMPDAIVIVNAEGKIIGSNVHAEKLFGYSGQELQGQSMAILVPERFRQTQRHYYASYFSQRGDRAPMTSQEFCGLHKDGREFPIEISTKPLAVEQGSVVTSAIRDVTQRKQVEQQIHRLNAELGQRATELEAANRELEAFSYSVSHDLRSPLQNIDSFSQILMQDYANRLDADGRDYVQRLRGSCQHMGDIIDALLALSNMMRTELRLEHVDLSALARAAAADCRQKNPDRVVDWTIADGLTADGDAQLLRVILENLFGNAWKFTAKRPKARIEFGALPQSDGVPVFFVRDDGAGFDMTRASTLFTPFKRLHDQSEFSGTGIGLATVQRVIQRHHGKIWAEGAVDHGATFCFTLKKAEAGTNGNDDTRADSR
jgi:PAS domain S-box-containing protein